MAPAFGISSFASRGFWALGLYCALGAVLGPERLASAQPPVAVQIIEPRLVHLRNDGPREWSSFPETAESQRLERQFKAEKNTGQYTLRVRQQDIKQAWRVALNGKPLGELVRDENDMIIYLAIPAGGLVNGQNVLRIESPARGPALTDDIRVGELAIDPRPLEEVLSESTLEIDVFDEATGNLQPARITITNESGSLQTTANISNDHLAVRAGTIYTSDGKARVGLPGGTYMLYAGRGFEYSFAKSEVTLLAGQPAQRALRIRREVPTPGYVACDTHIHTLTNSGHGDASISERMITLAAEGIELPIATDHNVHINYESHARRLNVRQHFTPVIGNEVTTSVGHFNVFPTTADAKVPDYKQKTWEAIFQEIFATPEVKVAILNHARDLHSGNRPFGPDHFNAVVGENLDGWPMRFNAMEVINSGATQTDPLRLVRDWMALLNRGYSVTPVGSSDSHDVSRYIVGQGRTYIRCDDRDAANLDVDAAVKSFLAGQVMVSYGLIAEMTVGGKFHSGDFATPPNREDAEVELSVLGPRWIEANRIHLYANGQLVRDEAISSAPNKDLGPGVKWQRTWKIARPNYDVHLVALALGPGVAGLHWPTAKPYQPTSPDWQPYVMGISGAVWLDGDGDGRRTSAREYAQRAFAASQGNPQKLMVALGEFDAATAAQAAHLLRASGVLLESEEIVMALKTAPADVQAGFRSYLEARRENERARAGQ
jgi:hypothetical protein